MSHSVRRQPLRAWDQFWFAPQTTRVLGLYRIAIGLITLYSFALFAKDITVFFSDAGVLTAHSLIASTPRLFMSVLVWIKSPAAVIAALVLLFAVAICFTLGLWTRASAILLFILVTSFHERNNLVLNSGDTVLRIMLFFFMFAPAGKAFAIDSLRMRLKNYPSPWPSPARGEGIPGILAAPWAQRMMQVQVAIIYFVTVYAKSRGDLWHSGHAMYYIFGLIDFHRPGVEQLMNFPILYSALTFTTLAVEISLPFLLWFRASRPYAVALGIGLHLWMMVAMILPVFPILMMATYIAFFSEDELNALIDRLKRHYAPARATVFFDAACPLCQRTRRIVTQLDLFERVHWRDARGAAREEFLAEMHLVSATGKTLKGYHAFRWMIARLPATFWMTPFFYIPGMSWIGTRVYRLIARNRTIALTCHGDSVCPSHSSIKT